jgi:hypothetical protein
VIPRALEAAGLTGLLAVASSRSSSSGRERMDDRSWMTCVGPWRASVTRWPIAISWSVSAARRRRDPRKALTEASEAAAIRRARRERIRRVPFRGSGTAPAPRPSERRARAVAVRRGRAGSVARTRRRRSHAVAPDAEAYLESGGRKAESARALHLERRSLYYRLDKIEKLLGRRLYDPATRVRLEVAWQGLDGLRRRLHPT